MRRGVVLTAVLAVSIATWYAVARTALLAHSVVAELDKAKALAELAPRPQATIVYDKNGKPAFTLFVDRGPRADRSRVAQRSTRSRGRDRRSLATDRPIGRGRCVAESVSAECGRGARSRSSSRGIAVIGANLDRRS